VRHGLGSRAQPSLLDTLTELVEDVQVAVAVAEIHANGPLWEYILHGSGLRFLGFEPVDPVKHLYR